MKLRRNKADKGGDEVIDLTAGADAWWATADDLVTVAPSYPRRDDPFDDLDPHRVLGVDHGASLEEIERARRALAKAYHPDLASAAAPFEIDLRERRMRAVNRAYADIKQARQHRGLD